MATIVNKYILNIPSHENVAIAELNLSRMWKLPTKMETNINI